MVVKLCCTSKRLYYKSKGRVLKFWTGLLTGSVYIFQDQIDHLKKLKISAATINSQIPAAERQRVIDDLRCVKTTIKLLYVAPEQAMTNTFKASIYLLCFLQFETNLK